MATIAEKQRRFWEYGINSHSGIKEYNLDNKRKADKQKKLSRMKTIEKRRLRELEKLN